MIDGYEDITRDVARGAGGILAVWCVADMRGPVVSSIGYLDREGSRDLFYAWHHWSGYKAVRIGEVRPDLAPNDPAWGDYLLSDMVRFGNSGMDAVPADYRFFQDFPSAVVTNGNPAVDSAFVDLVTCITAGRDWSRELYLINWYGYRFYDKERWKVRDRLEIVHEVERPDRELLARVLHDFRDRPGMNHVSIPDLPPALTSRLLVQQWLTAITKPYYTQRALAQIAKMWVGASKHVGREAWTRCASETGVMGFDTLADFFDRYNFPLWALEVCEARLVLELAVDGE